MNFQIASVLIVFLAMSILFLTGAVRYDLTALLGLLFFVFLGFIPPHDAFLGFSSPTIIVFISTFFLSEALFDTGVVDRLGRAIFKLFGKSEHLTILALMIITGLISSSMSNVSTTIIMMPIAAYLVRVGGFSPSKLFMPIAFASLLGGTLTLLGTTPNMIASDVLRASNLHPLTLFSFAPMGLAIMAVGTFFVIATSKWLLPKRKSIGAHQEQDIADIYGLKERLFSITIPKGSELAGKSLSSLQLGATLNIAVVAIMSGNQRKNIPNGSDILRVGDTLIVRGKDDHLKRLLALKNVQLEKINSEKLNRILAIWEPIEITISNRSLWIGKRIDSINLDEVRFALVAIKQNDKINAYDINRHYIEAGDVICGFFKGSEEKLSEMGREYSITTKKVEVDAFKDILFTIPFNSVENIYKSRDNDASFLSVSILHPFLVLKNSEKISIINQSTIFELGDEIVVACEPQRFNLVPELGSLNINSHAPDIFTDNQETNLIEVALTPRSVLIGQTINEVHFREKYGLQVLALWRQGKPIRTGLTDIVLRIGDALLLFGPPSLFSNLMQDHDFVILSDIERVPLRKDRALNLLSGLLLFTLMSLAHVAPIHIIAMTTAVFLVLTKAVSLGQVYKNIDWKLVVLVASLLPMGIALDTSGTSQFITNELVSLVGSRNPYFLLASVAFLSSFLSQVLDAGIAVVILGPIAIKAALLASISPYPLVMAVALGASIAFLTPFSHRANLVVMGTGGYKVKDYFMLGAPLSIILFATIIYLVPKFFPF
ncbi:MAG: SLC13 family permease [bacterium]|nr:SLC13 family permease [bacterium]